MSDETEGRRAALSRRTLLLRTMGSIGAASVIEARLKRALAAIKISKAAVAYQDHPDGDKRCDRCLQFQAPDSCKMVDGPVDPQGFCRIFTPVRQAAQPMRSVPSTG